MGNMFIGRINSKVDAKGRVVVPAQYRKILAGNEALVGRMDAEERYLMVFTAEEWELKVASLTAMLDEWSEEDNDKLMQWVGDAVEMEIDAQGRLLVPKAQKERMGVKGELAFVGMGKNFAIWDSAAYDEHCATRGKFCAPKKNQ